MAGAFCRELVISTGSDAYGGLRYASKLKKCDARWQKCQRLWILRLRAYDESFLLPVHRAVPFTPDISFRTNVLVAKIIPSNVFSPAALGQWLLPVGRHYVREQASVRADASFRRRLH